MKTFWKDSKGASLIELFISIVIISTLITGSLSLIFPALKNAEIAREKEEAKWYVWEQEEAVRQVRNEAWANLNPGNYYPQYNSVSNPPSTYQGWQLIPGSGIKNGFTENITISIPYRINANQLSDTTGTQDLNMRKVICSASWTSFGANKSISLTFYISNWKPF